MRSERMMERTVYPVKVASMAASYVLIYNRMSERMPDSGCLHGRTAGDLGALLRRTYEYNVRFDCPADVISEDATVYRIQNLSSAEQEEFMESLQKSI